MHPGDRIADRFVVKRLAGSGGMGKVYEGRDELSGQLVAIKVLSGHHGDDAQRFTREAQILSDLDHPRIVKHIQHGELPSGEHYLAMEWLVGDDLSARLSRGKLEPDEAMELGALVADALGFAHAKGIVHRDLKPSNIYLVDGATNGVRLIDFGIAQIDAVSRMTRTGMLMGTPSYMAPEQARGERRLDARADVFSLGCVLFECLVGEPAFTGVHLMAVLARILFDEPPTVLEKQPSVPVALSRLVARMMAKNPDDRPIDGSAVAELLRGLHGRTSIIPEAPPSAALTQSEQRAVAAILLSAPLQDISEASTILQFDERQDATLRREADLRGAELERLLDGSIAAILTSTGLATDLAAHAARCALAFRARDASRTIALAIGRGERMARLPMGPAIDRAARLIEAFSATKSISNAPPILVDERMAGLLDARFDVRENEGVFALYGEQELAEGTRTLLGKATPCVGRDWELRSLEEHFDECLEENSARAVLVTAPAGRGKSRLVHEFLRVVKTRGDAISVWIGRGDPLRAGSAFALLGQSIRGACGIRDGEPLVVRRTRLFSRIHECVADSERERVVEFLGELIGVPSRDDEGSLPFRAARRDPQLMFDQMRAAFLTFVNAACAAEPVLLVLEDLHWGDRPSVQFLDLALRELQKRPFFLIAAARPDVHELFPKLWSERRLQEFKLPELSRRAMERLARHVLGDAMDKETLDRLARLSEGNAFYLEELIRRASEGRGADLPETLVAMVQSRLHALDDDARRVLRAASVFGEVSWANGVASLLGGAAQERWTLDRLEELVEKEVIVRRGAGRFPDQQEFAFRHALLREAAYTMLTDQDRSLGHRLAGEWLVGKGEQDALVLAEHFERGGDGARAGQYYLRAAEQAFGGGDAGGAMVHSRRGIACRVEEPLRIKLLGVICEASIWLVESLPGTLRDAEELVMVAEPASKPWLQAMTAKLHCVVQAGKFDELMAAVDVLQQTPVITETAGLMVHSLASGLNILDNIGQIEKANAIDLRAEAIARSIGHEEPLTLILWHGMSALRSASTKKEPWRAIEHGRTAVARAKELSHPRFVGLIQAYLGMNLWLIGAGAEAEQTFNEIVLPDAELGYGMSRRYVSLSWLLAERGAFGEAKRWALHLAEAGKTRGVKIFEAQGRWSLAEVLRRAGELGAAEAEITTALDLLGDSNPLERPAFLASLAALRLAQNRPVEARVIVEDAVKQSRTMGACSRFFRDAFLALTHVECLDATGDRSAARAAALEAKEWVIGVASKIDDDDYRRRFLEEVPENRKILELAKSLS